MIDLVVHLCATLALFPLWFQATAKKISLRAWVLRLCSEMRSSASASIRVVNVLNYPCPVLYLLCMIRVRLLG